MSYEDFEWLMSINFWGVVYGTKAFLPHLKASGEGHVVNISSVFGLISVPAQSAYNAAKFAVRGFTDALRMELEIEGAAGLVHHRPPRGRQDQHRPQRPDRREHRRHGRDGRRRGRLRQDGPHDPGEGGPPDPRRCQGDRRRALIGPDAKVIDLVSRLPAGLYQRVLVRGSRRRH